MEENLGFLGSFGVSVRRDGGGKMWIAGGATAARWRCGGGVTVPRWWWEVMGGGDMVVCRIGCDGEERKMGKGLYGAVWNEGRKGTMT
jgi:hypothetical protein